LPSRGVATDAVTRNAVSTHVAQAGVVLKCRSKVDRAGKTIVCCKANAVPAIVRIASVRL
jgi:hypothetical protein